VTPIGLDHVQWLGPTLSHVAAEKAGIFKRGAPVVSAGQPRAAADVLETRAAELGISLWRPGRDYAYESRDVGPFCYAGPREFHVSLGEREEVVGGSEDDGGATRRSTAATAAFGLRAPGGLALLGHHQRGNAAVACALLQVAAGRGVPVRPEHLRIGLRTARWPGRLEVVAQSPLVLVDGAHNAHAARALVRAVRAILASRPVQLVFAAMADKDHAGMLRELVPLAAAVHLCAVDSPRAAAPEELAEVARRAGADFCSVHGNVAEALAAARAAAAEAKPEGVVVCCGSLYLAAEVEAALRGRQAVRMPSERL
jgi:dihydrofolate synthase/folylpolyglutamate synthase